ncbi:B3 domain-containing transcription factor ABI3 isoform X2 [Beta vulgaris subsp. vulgaris]|uniref:B3 domain-containing transcription factor ABI3 isoform X2 n=1 Tax=Beta vulgaris subsp. vulgaris TaxID=3555 RepID=UPI00203681B1|nr:B3 domain-containing transcription factor ABI3 isoform X2 [Beta vulgaris subsp. vulgaris]
MVMNEGMKNLELHGEDLQEFGVFHTPQEGMKDEEEIWFETASLQQENIDNSVKNNNEINTDNEFLDVDVSDPCSLFCADFPALPDFPCMSSSSSSSSTPVGTTKPFGACSTATSSSASTASSGAASWAVLKSDADHDPSSSTAVSVDIVAPPPMDHRREVSQEGVGMVLDDVDQCMDIMQNFGCIDLLENTDICWDPSPLFEENGDGDEREDNHYRFLQSAEVIENKIVDDDDDDRVFEKFMQQQQQQCGGSITTSHTTSGGVVDVVFGQSSGGGEDGGVNFGSGSSPDDLAMVFFEWLKSNKEMISAADLRNIKIKKSTIENAAKRLGGGKEGMKQLLKLILQWVQNHHLQNKRMTTAVEDEIQVASVNNSHNPSYSIQEHANNENNNNKNSTTPSEPSGNPSGQTEQQCFSPTTWLQPTPAPSSFVSDSAPMVSLPAPPPPAGFGPGVGYMGGDLYSGGTPMASYPPPMPPSDYHHSWGPTPMQYGLGPHYGSFGDATQFGGYGNPPAYPGFYYHPGPAEGLVRLGSSATKEARKKRMARQRRFFSHNHRSSHTNSQNNNNSNGVVNQQMINQMAEQHAAGIGNGNCGVAPHGNWVYWPPPPPSHVPPPQVNRSGPMVGQMMPPQPAIERPGNGFSKQVGIEKKQGWKTEKNLRFLLQKVLKQSDVGNLGRIVLPKKEAETHLPELEARDGIPIAMEDIGTSRVWNMRYRFWPNNKSRMYLLENTGDFVRSNGLQEGDFIVIYSDVKCGKYMIRGVKVRSQQQSMKAETTNKKSNKTQKTEGTSSPAGRLSSSPNIMQS